MEVIVNVRKADQTRLGVAVATPLPSKVDGGRSKD
jgi:hypothetical protein